MAARPAVTGKPKYPVKVTEETNTTLDSLLYSKHRAMKVDSLTLAVRLLVIAVDARPDLSISEAVDMAIMGIIKEVEK